MNEVRTRAVDDDAIEDAEVTDASAAPDAPEVEADAPEVGADADVPAAPAAGGVPAEVEVECPGCGLSLVGDTPRPTAAWFCPRCDYPLFWAQRPQPDAAAAAAAAGQKRARRRLPGTGGTLAVGAESCWHCGEMNEAGAPVCLRCAATLPKPTPPALPVPVVELTHRERLVVRTVVWPYVAAAVLAGASGALAAAGWVYGVL